MRFLSSICLTLSMLTASTVILSAGAPTAQAAPILRYQFSAHVGNAGQVAGVDLPVGATGVGTFTYDAASVDTNPDPSWGIYRQQRPDAFTFDILGLSIRADDIVLDSYTAEQGTFIIHNLGIPRVVNVNGVPTTMGVLFGLMGTGATDDLLPNPIVLGTTNTGNLTDIPTIDSPFFLIDSIEQIPVPEPSSMMLLGVGAIGVWMGMRTRRQG